jgi:hypothetical protein
MGIDLHLSTCVGTQSPKYLEMAQGHISLSAVRVSPSYIGSSAEYFATVLRSVAPPSRNRGNSGCVSAIVARKDWWRRKEQVRGTRANKWSSGVAEFHVGVEEFATVHTSTWVGVLASGFTGKCFPVKSARV